MEVGGFTPQAFAFGFFSILTLGGALGVVLGRNLFRGATYLVISLFGGAGLYVLLSAPFLAVIQVLVYIGAIAILITFAVMLTRSMTNIRERFTQQWALGGVISGGLFALILVGILLPVWGTGGTLGSAPLTDVVATTRELGIALVDGNGFVVPFEVASLLLTAAMIGAIVIAREDDVD